MKNIFTAIALLCIVILPGCKSKSLPDGMPPLSPFEIQVTQNGDPLADATVFFHSDAVPYLMGGKTDINGKATLKTQDYPGVPSGEFRVTVFKEVATPSVYGESAPSGEAGPEENQDLADAKAAAKWLENRRKEYRPTHSYVNKKYATKETTDLVVNTAGAATATVDVGAPVDDLFFPDDSSKIPPKK